MEGVSEDAVGLDCRFVGSLELLTAFGCTDLRLLRYDGEGKIQQSCSWFIYPQPFGSITEALLQTL